MEHSEPRTILEALPLLVVHPVVLAGANVDGKPTFTAISWTGIVNSDPPMLSISVRPGRHLATGIKGRGVFSVNIPSSAQVSQADWCGVVSGKHRDKTADCGFTVHYGATAHAPLIAQCPVSLECIVHSIQNLGSHDLIIGRIVAAHVAESCLRDGKPDPELIRPFVYTPGPAKVYRALGPVIAEAYSQKEPPLA